VLVVEFHVSRGSALQSPGEANRANLVGFVFVLPYLRCGEFLSIDIARLAVSVCVSEHVMGIVICEWLAVLGGSRVHVRKKG
jgi:hypothetical protein